MIPDSSSRHSAALRASTPLAGRVPPRISALPWAASTANSATRTGAPGSSRCWRSLGPTAILSSPAARSRASSSGRRAASAASAMTQSSCRKVVWGLSARSTPLGNIASATAPGPSPNSSTAASGAAEVSIAEPLAVYIHWPFCRSKCPYCDFNSHVRDRVDTARWTRALLADLDHHAELVSGREVGSVFFGGGTPSLMPPETVAALLDRVRSRWAAAPDLEVTLEANPNSAEAGRFRAFAAAGVNRLSLGVQAL